MSNLGGKSTIPNIGKGEFDALPRWLKELLWDTHIPLSVNPERLLEFTFYPPEVVANALKVLKQRDCYATYGPDHPQAREP